ncbi:MAG TPA: ATP-binding protein [Stellaceae bacterium]|nr:ATP-binding protein [Stellaceae bacterium]
MKAGARAKADAAPHFLAGGGEMGALMRRTDWSRTPIGPVETWSQSLRMMVSFLLANRFPLLLWWGPDYVSIYNDAYRPILGAKHPTSMGQPVRDCWSEIWHILKPLIDTPFTGGPATWMEDIPLEINRHGFVEETHFTIAYSPVPDETAPRGIGGVLATVHEITEKVVGERRVVALRDLGARAAEAKTAEDACAIAAAALAGHAKDVPFALLYVIDGDGTQARLAGAAGVAPGHAAAPPVVPLTAAASDGTWPLAAAAESEQMVVVEDIAARFGRVPAGPWSDPPRSAVVVPVRSTTAHRLAGLLVAGVSPRLRLDELYRSFFELAATQIATAIANARAYEEERKRAEALAEIDRAKTTFFSNVSHEFRTPLTLMLGPLDDALAAPAASLPQRRDDLALVHRNGLRLLRLVNTLLDFSRIEAGRVQASYEPVELACFTAELASVFRAATEKAGLELTVDCRPLAEPAWIDREMWEKIVLNLVSNAFKFTFEGGIAVRLRQEGRSAVLAVEDTGTGIPAHELPRLFDRFHRVEGARGRTQEGTGIGLALVQELAKLHGGTVRAESALGQGSTFTVTIPLGAAHLPPDRLRAERTGASTALGAQPFVEEALRWLPDDAARRGAEVDIERELLPSPRVAAAAGSERATVLLADDNADMRDYVRRLLAPRYEVRTVGDGAEALAALRARRADLLLSDVMMPRLDGFALVREIRADPALAELPILLLSARAGEEASIEGLEAGANDYLVKPFSARELLARVAANLEMARLRHARNQAAAALRDIERDAAAERDRAQETIRTSQSQLQAIFNDSPLGIYLVDSDFRIREVNPTARPTFGNIPELIGRDFEEVIHILWPDAYADEVVARFRHTLATGEPYIAPERIEQRLDRGVTEYYEWQINRIPLPEGRWGVVCYFRDISHQVLARQAIAASERRLRELNDSLERMVEERSRALEGEMAERQKVEAALQQAQRLEAIGQLTGGVAHDFNNLLTVVIGQAESIAAAADGNQQITRMAAAAQRAAERGAQLTNQLLSFSGRQQLRPVTLSVDKLIRSVGDLVRRTIGESITVEISVEPQLWRSHLDPAQFESAILNLAINARDAMPDGGRLAIDGRNVAIGDSEARRLDLRPGDYVVASVSDSGSGMTPEVRRRAFEPFFTTKDIGKGTGLGLSQIYGFVRQSGGTATIDSAPGDGTTVALYLPRADAPPVEEAAGMPRQGRRRGGGKIILVVEDQADVRDLIESSLRGLGYRVVTAADGVAARQLLESKQPIDLLLSDVVMPRGVSGLDLAEEARRLRQELKIVLVSGYLRGNQSRAKATSGMTFLEKPFRETELADAVASALGEKPPKRAE